MFARRPRTTWEVAIAINKANPHAIEKDLTAAVSWLRGNGLVVPTGDRGPSRGGYRRAQVLEVPDRMLATEWLGGRHPLADPVTNVEHLRRVARAADALLDSLTGDWSGDWERRAQVLREALKKARGRGAL